MKHRFFTASLAAAALICLVLLLTAGPTSLWAMQPPSPEEIEKYKADGTYAERLERALDRGNHQFKPDVLTETNQKIKRLYMKSRGLDYSRQELPEKPPGWASSFPSEGSPKLLVLLVDFPDYRHTKDQTVADIKLKMFGEGDPDLYPYESLSKFYERSSYGKLKITGEVLGWYTAANPRAYYESLGDDGVDTLIKEVFQYYLDEGHDFSQYDNDHDGVIDGFYLKWTGPDSGWSGFWWAFQSNFWDDRFLVNGKKLNYYCFSWYSNEEEEGSSSYVPLTDIHEMGHLLGLPDYYDYEPGVGPEGGVGGLDMMDMCYGDHNCFSKFALGWIEAPEVIASGRKTIALQPSGTAADAVLIMPDAGPAPFGQEFFMVQYRKKGVGNDPGDDVNWYDPFPADGFCIWHVDTTLDRYGETKYDNSTTEHKLLRLMEADGLEEIENSDGEDGIIADAGDFYLPPQYFGPDTTPNSNDYAGKVTNVRVDQLTAPGKNMQAVFSVGVSSGEVPFLDGYNDVWEQRTTPDPRKPWNIEFNQPVEPANMEEYVFITDENNTPIKTAVTVNEKIVTITPKDYYTANKQYRLYISRDIKSRENGKNLREGIVMPFIFVN